MPFRLTESTRPCCMNPPFFDHDTYLIAVAQGDHDAFIALYKHEAPRMLSLAKKMLGRNADAEEAVRDTFVLVWKHAESCDPSLTSARAWMYSIFRHRAMSTLREPGRMVSASTNWTDHLPAQPPEGSRPSRMYTTLQRLDGTQRRPLLMAYYHGYNPRQIAAKLGISTEQVQRQVQQGLRTILKAGQP